MSQQAFTRLWAWSESCAPVSGALAIVDIVSPVQVKDSVLGPKAYSVQLNLALTDGSPFQPVYQGYPSSGIWACFSNGSGKGISDTDYVEEFSDAMSLDMISGGGGLLLAVSPTSVLLWARRNGLLHGDPVYEVLDPGLSAPIRSAAVDIVGADNSSADFSSSSFVVELKLQGIKDMAFDGVRLGSGIPADIANLCGSPYGAFNSFEGGNLLETVLGSSPDDGWLRMAYNSP